MLSLVFSISNFYYNIVTVSKSAISNYFSKTSEQGLVENNIFLLGEHILFSCLGAYLFWEKEWLWDISMMWEENLTFDVSFYYVLYTIRYLVQIQMMTGEEKDYQSMMTHHISTVLLLTLSFIHYHRIGVIIALSHDLADLALLPAKLCHKFYETRKIKVLNFLSYTYFVSFFIVFFLTRISLNIQIILHVYHKGVFQIRNPNIHFEIYVLFLLLFVNLAIQIFWQIMIIKFSYKLAIRGNPKDEKGNEYFKQE